MDIKKKDLKALRRIRDRERMSMRVLFQTIGVLRSVHAPYIAEQDMGGAAEWFVSLGQEMQTRLIDDAMGVTGAREAGLIK